MDKQVSPEKELQEAAEKVQEKDVADIVEKQNSVETLIRKNSKLAKYLDDVKLLYSLLKDYMNGSYKTIPWYLIASITAALIYVLNPVDIIPDWIPVIGFMDDAAILSACMALVKIELEKYTTWKKANP